MNKTYEEREVEAIQKFLQSDRFLLAGTDAWYGNNILLGQTNIYCKCIVYNQKVETTTKLEGMPAYYIFKKCDFPEVPTREFWVVDLLNNIRITDLGKSEATRNLVKYLKNKLIDSNKLRKMSELYGRENSKAIIETAQSMAL
jgi:hypothetical protein